MKVMKTLNYIIFLLLLFCVPAAAEATSSLQAKIDAAPNGSKIEIEEGKYEEKIVISKPLFLVGTGKVTLYSCDGGPVITISGKTVRLKNIEVEHCGNEKEDAAVYVTGSNHTLEELEIKTNRFGIRLNQADGVTIRNSKIVGSNTGNGIDLWQSNRSHIENLMIANMTDGIYLEQSNRNSLKRNNIQHSRYGIHLMFSNGNVLKKNVSRDNTTGAMVMGSKQNVVSNNKFLFNHNNVNAQGLLIYTASYNEIKGNDIISNRVGVYAERSENNRIESNKIMNNFIGIQFKKANKNEATQNTFIGNVNDAHAIESPHNQINENYWDASSKVDMNGDGKSEISFAADPYFQTLTNDVPEYQLFFHAPGLIVIQNLLKSPVDQLLTDTAPLMDMTSEMEKEVSSNSSLWIMSACMIASSFILYLLGRRRG